MSKKLILIAVLLLIVSLWFLNNLFPKHMTYECGSGKNKEVRNLFDYHGLQVSRLKRVRFGSIFLDKDLKEGQLKELTSNEVDQIIKNGI